MTSIEQRQDKTGYPNGYDDVFDVKQLPAQVRSDEHVVRHGYAAEIGPDLWFWFDSLLPALAFGRAARMSTHCRSYHVVEAAHEVRFLPAERRDRRVLHITSTGLDRKRDERKQLQRWVDGIDTSSSHWQGPRT